MPGAPSRLRRASSEAQPLSLDVIETAGVHTPKYVSPTHWSLVRTTIEIDDQLMTEALRLSGESTKRAVIEAALRLLIQTNAQMGIRKLRGKIQWEGDLAELRRSRVRN